MTISSQPAYVTALQTVFNKQIVLFKELKNTDSLEKAALDWYKKLGELVPIDDQDEYQEMLRAYRIAWAKTWRQVYLRPKNEGTSILAALTMLADSPVASAISIWSILDRIRTNESAQKSLIAAFDDPAVAQLAFYSVGDGSVYRGLMIAAIRTSGEAIFMILLFEQD